MGGLFGGGGGPATKPAKFSNRPAARPQQAQQSLITPPLGPGIIPPLGPGIVPSLNPLSGQQPSAAALTPAAPEAETVEVEGATGETETRRRRRRGPQPTGTILSDSQRLGG